MEVNDSFFSNGKYKIGEDASRNLHSAFKIYRCSFYDLLFLGKSPVFYRILCIFTIYTMHMKVSWWNTNALYVSFNYELHPFELEKELINSFCPLQWTGTCMHRLLWQNILMFFLEHNFIPSEIYFWVHILLITSKFWSIRLRPSPIKK